MTSKLSALLSAGLGVLLLFSQAMLAWGNAESITYYHNDHLGSPIVATDQNGDVLWKHTYYAYGEELYPAGDKTGNAHGYTGHQSDKETGLVYMQARYYDPSIGRFLAMDPVGFDESNPQSFNRYAYANNNPYRYVDPDGRYAHIVIGAGVGALINGAAYAFTTDNFTWGGLARETTIGAVVGGVTAAVPGAINAGALNFGGKLGNTAAKVSSAAAAGTAGSVASQSLQGKPISYEDALIAGGANAGGLLLGDLLKTPARYLSSTTIPAQQGLPVTSLRGKTFMIGSKPAVTTVDQTTQQLIQDIGGAAISTAASQQFIDGTAISTTASTQLQ